jgi:hypothetical protein
MSVTIPVVVTILKGPELSDGRVVVAEPDFAEASDDAPVQPYDWSPISSRLAPKYLSVISFVLSGRPAILGVTILYTQNFDFYDYKPLR